jgi:hypothetical protein
MDRLRFTCMLLDNPCMSFKWYYCGYEKIGRFGLLLVDNVRYPRTSVPLTFLFVVRGAIVETCDIISS